MTTESQADASLRRKRRRQRLSRQRHERCSIRNFRSVSGLEDAGIYRCGSTDVLGAKIRTLQSQRHRQLQTTNLPWSPADQLVSRHAGLVIDLRSPPERREEDSQLWMQEAIRQQPERPIRIVTVPLGEDTADKAAATAAAVGDTATAIFGEDCEVENFRYVIGLDILNRAELLGYVRERWLTELPLSSTSSSLTSSLENRTDRDVEANQIMTELNKRGLAGLNEAILETSTGQKGLCRALQVVTLYKEAWAARQLGGGRNGGSSITKHRQKERSKSILDDPRNASIVFHCVQGKDRTGMLAMLMQILMGCSDEVIVEDYYRSNAAFIVDTGDAASAAAAASFRSSASKEPSSAAASSMATTGRSSSPQLPQGGRRRRRQTKVRMDPSVFRGTNRPAMRSTLAGLRFRHGTTLEGYFDRIGFDRSWRNRFVAVVGGTTPPMGSGEPMDRRRIPPVPSSRL